MCSKIKTINTSQKGGDHLTKIVSPWERTVAPNHWWDLKSTCWSVSLIRVLRSPGETDVKKKTLSYSRLIKHAFIQLDPSYPNYPFTFLAETPENICAIGRQLGVWFQLHFLFHAKISTTVWELEKVTSAKTSRLRSETRSRLDRPVMTLLTLCSVWPPGQQDWSRLPLWQQQVIWQMVSGVGFKHGFIWTDATSVQQ